MHNFWLSAKGRQGKKSSRIWNTKSLPEKADHQFDGIKDTLIPREPFEKKGGVMRSQRIGLCVVLL
jgi:hypothetical protein